MTRCLLPLLMLVLLSCAQKTAVKGQQVKELVTTEPPPCQCQAIEKAQNTQVEEKFLTESDLIPPTQVKGKLEKARKLQRKGYLYIVTVPENATVLLDGVEVGKGVVFRTIEGNRFRQLSVRAQDYREVQGYVEVVEDEVQKFKISLEPAGGAITVLSTPIGAKVFLDEEPKGATPITIKPVQKGKHTVKILLEDKVNTSEITIGEGETKVLEVDLSPKVAKEPEPQVAKEPEPQKPREPEQTPIAKKVEETQATQGQTMPQPASTSPEPQKQVIQQEIKPDCGAVCKKLKSVLQGSQSVKDLLMDKCRQRCEGGDLKFALCAWKAQNNEDAQKCFTLQGQ